MVIAIVRRRAREFRPFEVRASVGSSSSSMSVRSDVVGVVEALYRGGRGSSLRMRVALDVLKLLKDRGSISISELKSLSSYSSDYLSNAINFLRELGLVDVRGELVILSDKAENILLKLEEKMVESSK